MGREEGGELQGEPERYAEPISPAVTAKKGSSNAMSVLKKVVMGAIGGRGTEKAGFFGSAAGPLVSTSFLAPARIIA